MVGVTMEYTIGIAAVVFIGLIALIFKQQRTIDKLTDKLMSRDYRDYKSLNKETDVTPTKDEEEKLSWHDH